MRSEHPIFLYGERTGSRKIPRSRMRRTQSANVRRVTPADKEKGREGMLQRPKTASATFGDVREKVRTQMEISLDWDPNTDEFDDGGESDVETAVWHDSKSVQWAHDINSRSASAIMHYPSRPVSKQQAKKRTQGSAKEVPKVDAVEAVQVANVGRRNQEKPKRPMTSVGFLEKTKRSEGKDKLLRPKTSKPQLGRSLQPVKEDTEDEKGDESREPVEKGPGHSIENSPEQAGMSVRGRKHPMVAIVNSARKLAGRSKRIEKMVTTDTGPGKFITPAEKKKEQKKAKIESQRNESALWYQETLENVKAFLAKFPAPSLQAPASKSDASLVAGSEVILVDV